MRDEIGAIKSVSDQSVRERERLDNPAAREVQSANTTRPVAARDEQDSRAEKVRTDQRIEESQRSQESRQRVEQQRLQIADERVASTVITGEYDASRSQRQGAPRVGGSVSATL
jgi:hypothetical protein